MKAAVYKNNKIQIQEFEKPELTDLGAIIKVRGCGLCGSDIVKYRQNLVSNGSVLGHEIVGEIIEINSKSDFKIGDNVVIGHHVPCFDSENCRYCRNKSYSMCRNFKRTNIKPGGFAEYIYVSEEHLQYTVSEIPQGLSDVEASYTEPIACCLRAIKRANIKQGDKVLVIGLGSIGLLMGQALKSYGAFVTGSDILDERLELAKRSGFDEAIKYNNLEEFVTEYKLKNGGFGADKVFLVSGSLSSIPVAIKSVIDGGTIVVFSSVSLNNATFSNNEIYYRELTLMSTYSSSPDEIKESIQLIKSGKIKLNDYATIYELDKVGQAIEDTISNKILKAYIII